jgi:hypothetical protein
MSFRRLFWEGIPRSAFPLRTLFVPLLGLLRTLVTPVLLGRLRALVAALWLLRLGGAFLLSSLVKG